ncbi:hypothetical protein H8959_017063 [Pygathrix nigripes]
MYTVRPEHALGAEGEAVMGWRGAGAAGVAPAPTGKVMYVAPPSSGVAAAPPCPASLRPWRRECPPPEALGRRGARSLLPRLSGPESPRPVALSSLRAGDARKRRRLARTRHSGLLDSPHRASGPGEVRPLRAAHAQPLPTADAAQPRGRPEQRPSAAGGGGAPCGRGPRRGSEGPRGRRPPARAAWRTGYGALQGGREGLGQRRGPRPQKGLGAGGAARAKCWQRPGVQWLGMATSDRDIPKVGYRRTWQAKARSHAHT